MMLSPSDYNAFSTDEIKIRISFLENAMRFRDYITDEEYRRLKTHLNNAITVLQNRGCL